MLKILSNLRERRRTKNRQPHYYREPLSDQRERLRRMARLLECSPDEAQELMQLTMEWLWNAGALSSKMVPLDKSVKSEMEANVSPEIKAFLMQNGLCD